MADPPLKSQELEALEAAVRCVCSKVWPPQRSDLDALKCELATFMVCFGEMCDDGRRRVNAALAGSHLTNFWKRYAASRPGMCAAKWGKLKQLMAGESRFDLDSPPGRPSNLEVFLDCRDIYAQASAEGWLGGPDISSSGGYGGSSSGSAAPADAAAVSLGGLSLATASDGSSLADDAPPGIGVEPAGNGAAARPPFAPSYGMPSSSTAPAAPTQPHPMLAGPSHLAPFGPLPSAPPYRLTWDPLPQWDPSQAEAILGTRVLQLQKALLDARSQALEANRVAQSAQEALTKVLGQLGGVQTQLASAQEQIVALRRWAENGRRDE